MTLSHDIKHIGAAGWTRIGVAVLLIIGAYMAGVIAGLERGDYHGYGDRWANDYKHTMSGKYDKMKCPMMGNMDDTIMTHDPMQMSMADMGKMLEGKTGAELNKAFLEGMIPHHQGAIEMAKYLASSDKPELVKLGGDIITAQSKEIEQMKAWLIEWGYVSTGATTSTGEMDMMREHCQTMPDMPGCDSYR